MITGAQNKMQRVELAKKLKDLRTQNAFRQEDVADKIGVHPRTVATWENPEKYWGAPPSLKNKRKLAELYGVTPQSLDSQS